MPTHKKNCQNKLQPGPNQMLLFQIAIKRGKTTQLQPYSVNLTFNIQLCRA